MAGGEAKVCLWPSWGTLPGSENETDKDLTGEKHTHLFRMHILHDLEANIRKWRPKAKVRPEYFVLGLMRMPRCGEYDRWRNRRECNKLGETEQGLFVRILLFIFRDKDDLPGKGRVPLTGGFYDLSQGRSASGDRKGQLLFSQVPSVCTIRPATIYFWVVHSEPHHGSGNNDVILYNHLILLDNRALGAKMSQTHAILHHHPSPNALPARPLLNSSQKPWCQDQVSQIHQDIYKMALKWIFKSSIYSTQLTILVGLPGGSVVKNPLANAGDMGLIPGSGRFPGEGNSNPFLYSCLGNPMDRGAWQASVHGEAKNQTWLSNKDNPCLTGFGHQSQNLHLWAPSQRACLLRDWRFHESWGKLSHWVWEWAGERTGMAKIGLRQE